MIYIDIKFLIPEISFKLKKLADDINDLFKDSDDIIKKILLKKKLKQDKIKLVLLMLYVIFLIIHL